MYRIYSEKEEKQVYPYEERLIPKETVAIAKEPEIQTDSFHGNFLQNMAKDDLIIIGLLIFLLYGGCDDWILILALVVLLILV